MTLSKMLGFPDLSKLKGAIPDRELVGYCWHTWSASDLGVGERYDDQGGNLAVWFRIGAEQMPEPVEVPTACGMFSARIFWSQADTYDPSKRSWVTLIWRPHRNTPLSILPI